MQSTNNWKEHVIVQLSEAYAKAKHEKSFDLAVLLLQLHDNLLANFVLEPDIQSLLDTRTQKMLEVVLRARCFGADSEFKEGYNQACQDIADEIKSKFIQ